MSGGGKGCGRGRTKVAGLVNRFIVVCMLFPCGLLDQQGALGCFDRLEGGRSMVGRGQVLAQTGFSGTLKIFSTCSFPGCTGLNF